MLQGFKTGITAKSSVRIGTITVNPRLNIEENFFFFFPKRGLFISLRVLETVGYTYKGIFTFNTA